MNHLISITGGIEQDPPGRYWRKHTANHGGWYYRSGSTAVEATRLILESVAPHHHPKPWVVRSLTNARGPLDWPSRHLPGPLGTRCAKIVGVPDDRL